MLPNYTNLYSDNNIIKIEKFLKTKIIVNVCAMYGLL